MVNPSSMVILVWPNTQKKARDRSAKAPFGRGSERDALIEGQFGGLGRMDPVAALVEALVDWFEGDVVGAAHGLGELAGFQESGAEGAVRSGGSVGVGVGVADHAPAGPQVEAGLVLDLHGLRSAPRWHGQIAQRVRHKIGAELAIEEERVTSERFDPSLMGDRLEGLVDAGLGQHVVSHGLDSASVSARRHPSLGDGGCRDARSPWTHGIPGVVPIAVRSRG
jgi:hypothetical protein